MKDIQVTIKKQLNKILAVIIFLLQFFLSKVIPFYSATPLKVIIFKTFIDFDIFSTILDTSYYSK